MKRLELGAKNLSLETFSEKANNRSRALEALARCKQREAELAVSQTESVTNGTRRTYKMKKNE